MKKIILLLTILAISCSPVRKGYFKYEPEQPTKKEQVSEDINRQEVESQSYEDEYFDDEYEPSEQYSNTYSDVYYPEGNLKNDTSNNYYSSKSDLFTAESEVINETIDFSNTSINEPINIINDYDEALSQFDLGNYSAAERKLRALSETLKEDDTLTYKTKFYLAECHIAKNEFSQALQILKKLEIIDDTNSEIKQKTFVRLGQIYCVLNMKENAYKYFEKLKMKYPDSIYNKLGKCQ